MTRIGIPVEVSEVESNSLFAEIQLRRVEPNGAAENRDAGRVVLVPERGRKLPRLHLSVRFHLEIVPQ